MRKHCRQFTILSSVNYIVRSTLPFYYEVIRVVYNGITKDFVVTNNDSARAMTPDGDKYIGGFKPV